MIYTMTDNGSKGRLEEILERRQLSKDEALCLVKVVDIEPTAASTVLRVFTEELPLHHFGLGHLKRLRRSKVDNQQSPTLEVVVCPSTFIDNDIPSKVMALCTSFREVLVPKYQPLTRAEFEEWCTHWPITFRPKSLDRERERGPGEEEIALALQYMRLVQEDAELCSKELGRPPLGGVIVNPENNKIVTTSYKTLMKVREKKGDLAINYVFNTPSLLCIEGTSAIVRGENENDNILPDDAYLCTGLDLYLTEEPDLFSAMALIHSRIRRVVYLRASPEHGAIGTLYNIHELRSLNHHFRVYKFSFE